MPAPKPATRKAVADGFVNFEAKLGVGANNQFSGGRYSFDFLTHKRSELEAAYRTSWLVGAACDMPAEDMTRAGIEIASTHTPAEIDRLQAGLNDLMVWQRLAEAVKWARLFGGAIAVLLIDGQDLSTPLRPETVGQEAFKGLLVLDRWTAIPSTELVSDYGPSFGLPVSYAVTADAQALPGMTVHHSRVLRFTGLDLPYYQRQVEQGWGESVVERIHDRLLAFDSASQGAAQLVFKAHLRTWKIPKLRELIAAGGKLLDAVTKQVAVTRAYQSNEGLTLIDAEDSFDTHAYNFAGLDTVLLQFGQQLAGALETPLVRLFGQSPAGLNSSGESDLRTYYEGIGRKQETYLRRPLGVILDILCRSLLGAEPPEGFNFTFRPLWQTSDRDKSAIARETTAAVVEAFTAGVVDRETAIKELRQGSRVSGVWSNVGVNLPDR